MAELLLINPRSRTNMARKTRRKATRSAAQKRATAKMLAANRARRAGRKPARKARRSNPIAAVRRSYGRRVRRNPIRARRRRNPIALGGIGRGMLAQFKDAAIGGAGAVGVDIAYGYVTPYLPPSLQRTPGSVGLGDAVKALFTVALGTVLAKPTRGLSRKMAAGALTVQAAQMIASFVPASLKMGGRVGWASPAAITQGTARVNPIRSGVNAYVPGSPPLLNGVRAYVPGAPPLLNGARQRESVLR